MGLLDPQGQTDQVVQVVRVVHYYPWLPQVLHCLEFLVGQVSLGILLGPENHADPATTCLKLSATPNRRSEDNVKTVPKEAGYRYIDWFQLAQGRVQLLSPGLIQERKFLDQLNDYQSVARTHFSPCS